MLTFKDENDHQILRFDTEEREEKVLTKVKHMPDKKYFYSKVYDKNDQLIDEFEHNTLRDRVYFYKGYIAKNK